MKFFTGTLLLFLISTLCTFSSELSKSSRAGLAARIYGKVHVGDSKIGARAVYVVNSPALADLCVYVSKNAILANRPGLWFYTKHPIEAKHRIYFVSNPALADLKIYFVNNPTLAGVRK